MCKINSLLPGLTLQSERYIHIVWISSCFLAKHGVIEDSSWLVESSKSQQVEILEDKECTSFMTLLKHWTHKLGHIVFIILTFSIKQIWYSNGCLQITYFLELLLLLYKNHNKLPHTITYLDNIAPFEVQHSPLPLSHFSMFPENTKS